MANFDYNFIDMHCHVLPGVDDGSHDPEMSRQMLRVAAENNIHEMILTPHHKPEHHNVSMEGMKRRIGLLEEICGEENIDMRFHPGNELFYSEDLIDELEAGTAATLAESRYVLVEFYPMEQYSSIDNALRELRYADYTVILAHVERYICLTEQKSLDRVEALVRAGTLLQVNSLDVVPHIFKGGSVAKFVNRLLREELVSFVGTDAHRPEGRAPLMNECAAYLQRHYDEDYVYDLLRGNAERVIGDEEI